MHGARIVVKDTRVWGDDEGAAMSSTAVRAAVRASDEAALRRMLWPSAVEYHRRHGIAYDVQHEKSDSGGGKEEEEVSRWREFVAEACEGLWLPHGPALQCGAALGSGRTARVAAGALGGSSVAVKRFWLTGPAKETRLRAQCLAREVLAARRLAVQDCAAHVCFALGAAWLEGSRGVALLLPLCSCSLREVLAQLDDASAALVVAHTARGMRAVARAKLLHRDLHCGNVLVERSTDGGPQLLVRAAVADFGLCKSENDPTVVVKGETRCYPPEAGANLYTLRADVFAWALLCGAALLRRDDFSGDSGASERLRNGARPRLPENAPYREVLERAWSHEWERRPDFEGIVAEIDQ